MLHMALDRYLTLFTTCYGQAEALPKHHFAMHLPSIWLRFGYLLACFVHERRHRAVKRYAQGIENTSIDYEHSIIAEFTHHHLMQLKTDFSFMCVAGLVPLAVVHQDRG